MNCDISTRNIYLYVIIGVLLISHFANVPKVSNLFFQILFSIPSPSCVMSPRNVIEADAETLSAQLVLGIKSDSLLSVMLLIIFHHETANKHL